MRLALLQATSNYVDKQSLYVLLLPLLRKHLGCEAGWLPVPPHLFYLHDLLPRSAVSALLIPSAT